MKDTKTLTKLGLFTAIIMMLGLTPLGFITIGAVGITTVHIPVILGSFIFNLKQSAYLGLIFGLTSFIRCFTTPDGISAIVLGNGNFGVYNLVLIVAIVFIPRVLVGVFTYLSHKILSKIKKTQKLAMPISAFIGSMTNTVFVLGGLYVWSFEQSAVGFGVSDANPWTFLMVLIGVVVSNGIIEAVVAVLVSSPVGAVVKKFNK